MSATSVAETCEVCGRRIEVLQSARLGDCLGTGYGDCYRLGYERQKARADRAEKQLATLRALTLTAPDGLGAGRGR